MNLARFLSLLMALAVTASIAEAQNTPGRPTRTKPVAKQPAGRDRDSKAALSEQECLAYARALTKAFSAGDLAAFNALIDWDALFGTTLDGLGLTGNQRQEFMKELKGTLANEVGLTGQLVKNGKAGGKFAYLRSRQNHGRQVVLMRMLQPSGSGGVGYFEFVPKPSADGKTRAVDIYIYLNAEFFSATLRRALLPVVASQSRTFLDKLLTSDRD